MRDIHWDRLSSVEKVIFVLGWFAALSIFFWLIMLIAYVIKYDKKGYSNFFNPHTFKVPYVFGWINLVVIIFMFFMMLLMFTFFFGRLF